MLRSLSMRNLIYYGEVFGFVAAWAAAIIIALTSQPREEATPDPRGLAAVTLPQSSPTAID